jgi:hypothetical protein
MSERERAAAEMAGRTVWCLTGRAARQEPARRLHSVLNRLGPEGVAARRRQVAAVEPLGDALLGDEVSANDVLVLHDSQVAPLAEVARERGTHVVLRWSPGLGPIQASRLLRLDEPIDAFLLSAHRRLGAGASRESLTVAVPAIGRVTSSDVRAAGEGSLEDTWLGLLAGIVHDDRSEIVGGILHARPIVPPR